MKNLLFLIVFGSITSISQNTSAEHPVTVAGGSYIDWRSVEVRDSLRTYVYLPSGYYDRLKKYPVLIITDGDWSFTNAINCFANLKQDYFITEPVIVAIGYGNRINQRARDLDPAKAARAFLRCIKKEVIPWIKTHYNTTDTVSLYGYSLGGKFATFALFAEPELFSAVMIGAPADHSIHLMPSALSFKKQIITLPKLIYVAAGSYEKETVENINRFAAWLNNQNAKLNIYTWSAPDMNHGAAISAIMQRALLFSYGHSYHEQKLKIAQISIYAGIYRDSAHKESDYHVIVKDGELQIVLHGYKQDFPYKLHAINESQFFIEEDQRLLYSFTPGGQLNIRLPDKTEIKLTKK